MKTKKRKEKLIWNSKKIYCIKMYIPKLNKMIDKLGKNKKKYIHFRLEVVSGYCWKFHMENIN